MKKSVIAAVLMAIVLALSAPAFAAADWDTFVADMQRRSNIKEMGPSVLRDIRAIEPSGTEYELWSKLWSGEPKMRAAAGLAIIDRIFPNGDPARWEEVRGFLSKHSLQPRQLAAMDGLFVTIAALKELPDGVWASAYLLDSFGKSAMGRVKFIDEIPADLRPVIDEVLSKTGLPGDWTSKKIRGKMPMLPVYRGYIRSDAADFLNMEYLDGYGSISGNGPYVWDRDRGYIYKVFDDSRRDEFITD